MQILSNFVDMAKSPAEMQEDKLESAMPGLYPQNIYPYGLCICLDNESLEKIGLSEDAGVGDQVHFQAIGKVTSSSARETDQGAERRIEIQITHLSLGDMHDEEPASKPRVDINKFYNSGEE